jgi:hypothetical protein
MEIPSGKIEPKPVPARWSPKEEPGRQLDLAANNHQRSVRTNSKTRRLCQDMTAIVGFNSTPASSATGWRELVDPWKALSQQLLAAAKAVWLIRNR